MGSERSEEEKRSKEIEKQQIEKRIETFKNLIDQAYVLFDGKYTIEQIEHMPYGQLMEKIDRERKIIEKTKEYKEKTEQETQQNQRWR